MGLSWGFLEKVGSQIRRKGFNTKWWSSMTTGWWYPHDSGTPVTGMKASNSGYVSISILNLWHFSWRVKLSIQFSGYSILTSICILNFEARGWWFWGDSFLLGNIPHPHLCDCNPNIWDCRSRYLFVLSIFLSYIIYIHTVYCSY